MNRLTIRLSNSKDIHIALFFPTSNGRQFNLRNLLNSLFYLDISGVIGIRKEAVFRIFFVTFWYTNYGYNFRNPKKLLQFFAIDNFFYKLHGYGCKWEFGLKYQWYRDLVKGKSNWF